MTEEDPTPESIFNIGTVGMITRMRKLSDGRIKNTYTGYFLRGKITSYIHTKTSS